MANNVIKCLELFAGSQSFTKVAKELNYFTYTSDILPIKGIDYVVDILDFNKSKVPFIPDVIWASPDCAAWSKAAGNIHFKSKSLVPQTEKAANAFKIIDKTIEIIFYFLTFNRELKYYIENPEGKMQKYLQAGTLFGKIPRLVTIDQCQYGREFQKTTHIFTNNMNWKPKNRCKGLPNCHHIHNTKNSWVGMKTSLGALDRKAYYERAKIPYQLCKEILLLNSDLQTG